MSFIFIDESGNLGFNFDKKGTTSYFVITFLFTTNRKIIDKCVDKTVKSLKSKYRKKGHLHAYKEEPSTKKRLLAYLSSNNCMVMAIVLNKKKVYTNLHNAKPFLYNYVVNILLDRILSKNIIDDNNISIIASRRETSDYLNNNFKTYLESQVTKNYSRRIEIIIKNHSEDKGLQAVDFVSWSIFKKYEYGVRIYYDIIRTKIIEENLLFP